MARLRFQARHLEVEVPSGTELLQVAQRHPELPLKFGCRHGECGVCVIKVMEGAENLTRQAPQEARLLQSLQRDVQSHRLACQCAINGPVTLE